MAEDKARDRVESGDSERECNAVFRPQGPDAARMDFINGLIRAAMILGFILLLAVILVVVIGIKYFTPRDWFD